MYKAPNWGFRCQRPPLENWITISWEWFKVKKCGAKEFLRHVIPPTNNATTNLPIGIQSSYFCQISRRDQLLLFRCSEEGRERSRADLSHSTISTKGGGESVQRSVFSLPSFLMRCWAAGCLSLLQNAGSGSYYWISNIDFILSDFQLSVFSRFLFPKISSTGNYVSI
jgi:hypothetical protein